METSLRIFLNRWFVFVTCLGIFALVCSSLAVHVFQLKPCTLCKLQRIPFALLMANAALGLIGSHKKGFFRITQICLGLGVILGTTHFLIQLGRLPDFCISPRDFESPEDFVKILQISKCSSIAWFILGVPVSLLNAMLHGFVLGISIRLKAKKNSMRGVT